MIRLAVLLMTFSLVAAPLAARPAARAARKKAARYLPARLVMPAALDYYGRILLRERRMEEEKDWPVMRYEGGQPGCVYVLFSDKDRQYGPYVQRLALQAEIIKWRVAWTECHGNPAQTRVLPLCVDGLPFPE